jgi:steroid 5-alpha reductase family enzyme
MTTVSPDQRAYLYKRGCVTNGVGALILGSVAYGLSLQRYVVIAAGIQLAVFLLHALPNASEKFYDLSGSFTHLSLVLTGLLSTRGATSPRQIACALMAIVWMVRLGTFLYGRILRDGKDERFDRLKPVWLSFMGAWNFQANWVVLGELPVLLITAREDKLPISFVDYVAITLWALGFLIEVIADHQKYSFRNEPNNRHQYITSGLWKYSRHPNYFGELLMWSSMAACVSYVGFATGDTVLFWAWLSPLFTAFLLLRVSGVPLVEAAGKQKWGSDPRYLHYMEHTSCIVPWFPAPPLQKTD